MKKNALVWLFRLIPAIIMLQTLRYKLTGDPLAVHIFSTIGAEPVGRLATGVLELVAGVALLIPALSPLGALMGVGLMLGAVLAHLTVLGIEVQGDGGALFQMAVMVLITSAVALYLQREQAVGILNKLRKK